MAIAVQTIVDAHKRTVLVGTGGAGESAGTFVNVSALSSNNTSFSLIIDAQGEANYNGGANNGTFVGGTGHAATDVLTMSDGSTITVDTVGSGIVTEFTVLTASTSGHVVGDTITQTGSDAVGVGFTLTTDTNNVVVTARVNIHKITWSVARGTHATNQGIVTLLWDAAVDVIIMKLSGNGAINLPHQLGSALLNRDNEAATGDILLTSDANVLSYTVGLEVHKEAGYTDPSMGI